MESGCYLRMHGLRGAVLLLMILQPLLMMRENSMNSHGYVSINEICKPRLKHDVLYIYYILIVLVLSLSLQFDGVIAAAGFIIIMTLVVVFASVIACCCYFKCKRWASHMHTRIKVNAQDWLSVPGQISTSRLINNTVSTVYTYNRHCMLYIISYYARVTFAAYDIIFICQQVSSLNFILWKQ